MEGPREACGVGIMITLALSNESWGKWAKEQVNGCYGRVGCLRVCVFPIALRTGACVSACFQLRYVTSHRSRVQPYLHPVSTLFFFHFKFWLLPRYKNGLKNHSYENRFEDQDDRNGMKICDAGIVRTEVKWFSGFGGDVKHEAHAANILTNLDFDILELQDVCALLRLIEVEPQYEGFDGDDDDFLSECDDAVTCGMSKRDIRLLLCVINIIMDV
ncbi:hypothetical protein VNO78_03397 [Psophocarpus tetragonolobus]|uniref:Uncharacterized protein n=1 Tax=Psophocarpus tetragonolobus TaxID=3891 RepID=A0AAN9T494_PSOTE